MTYLESGDWREASSPLGIIVSLAETEEWVYEQPSADELAMDWTGKLITYRVVFTWMGDIELLHLALSFELKIPPHRLSSVHELVRKINEILWLGHFDLWIEDGLVMYRSALPLAGGSTANASQCYDMFQSALSICEKFFPAFQFVVWAGKNAGEAMQSVELIPEGNA